MVLLYEFLRGHKKGVFEHITNLQGVYACPGHLDLEHSKKKVLHSLGGVGRDLRKRWPSGTKIKRRSREVKVICFRVWVRLRNDG